MITLASIKGTWSGKRMEDLFTDGDKKKIISLVNDDVSYTKNKFNRSIQECLAVSANIELTKTTQNNFRLIFDSTERILEDLYLVSDD